MRLGPSFSWRLIGALPPSVLTIGREGKGEKHLLSWRSLAALPHVSPIVSARRRLQLRAGGDAWSRRKARARTTATLGRQRGVDRSAVACLNVPGSTAERPNRRGLSC